MEDVAEHSTDPAVRSYLYVPGDRADRLATAGQRGADALILDLEDSVSVASKDRARYTVASWLAGPALPRCQLWLRINPGQAGQDIEAGVSAAVAGVVLPKADAGLLGQLDDLLSRCERGFGLDPGRFRVIPLIETAAGLLDVAAIAAAPRVLRLGLGEADLAAELRLRPGPDRAELTPLRLQIVVASAARGIAAPIAPVSTDFRDLAALRASTEALLRLGFRARTAIHPAQLATINEVFTPSADEVGRARRLLAALDAAGRTGSGVTTDEDGRMIDEAVARSAREILAQADRPAAP
jgi:citrate lyase subunit beta / citryl-CoA lyase